MFFWTILDPTKPANHVGGALLFSACPPVLFSLVPNSVTTIFGFSLIRHDFSLTTVTKLLRQRHGLKAKICQDTHKVEIIMVRHFFLSLIVDIVLKVITDSTPIIFIAIYPAITIPLCLLAIRFSRRFHK